MNKTIQRAISSFRNDVRNAKESIEILDSLTDEDILKMKLSNCHLNKRLVQLDAALSNINLKVDGILNCREKLSISAQKEN